MATELWDHCSPADRSLFLEGCSGEVGGRSEEKEIKQVKFYGTLNTDINGHVALYKDAGGVSFRS